MAKISKFLWLWLKCAFYYVTSQSTVLLAEGSYYYIDEGAIRDFSLTLSGARFTGCINGRPCEFFVELDKIITITTIGNEPDGYL